MEKHNSAFNTFNIDNTVSLCNKRPFVVYFRFYSPILSTCHVLHNYFSIPVYLHPLYTFSHILRNLIIFHMNVYFKDLPHAISTRMPLENLICRMLSQTMNNKFIYFSEVSFRSKNLHT